MTSIYHSKTLSYHINYVLQNQYVHHFSLQFYGGLSNLSLIGGKLNSTKAKLFLISFIYNCLIRIQTFNLQVLSTEHI